MEGATSAITGETYETTSDGYTKYGETYVKHDGGNTYISKQSGGRNGRSDNHIHYFDNPEAGNKNHKSDYEVGERLSSNKSEKAPASNDLFSGIKYFLGLD